MRAGMRALLWAGVLLGVLLLPVTTATPAAAVPSDRPFEIVTIPPTPAARFTLDGQPLPTDGRGVARALVPPSPNGHRIELVNPETVGPNGTTQFVRWHGHGDTDQGYTPVLNDIRIDHRVKLQVAFQEKRTFRFAFVDQSQRPVDPSRVSAVTLRSDANRSDTVPGSGSMDLVTVRPAVGDGPPVAKESTYSVQSVMIDGTNVVNVGEQRFRPTQGEPVLQIVVLLRSAHFRVRDRFLGHPVVTTLQVTYPDGRRFDLPTDANGELVLQNLARGTYRVSAAGQAYAVDQELALSRSQFVDLNVLTYVDACIAAGVALVGVVGLLWVGAIRTRRHRRSVHRAATAAAGRAPTPEASSASEALGTAGASVEAGDRR
jgi:hypothetical protein